MYTPNPHFTKNYKKLLVLCIRCIRKTNEYPRPCIPHHHTMHLSTDHASHRATLYIICLCIHTIYVRSHLVRRAMHIVRRHHTYHMSRVSNRGGVYTTLTYTYYVIYLCYIVTATLRILSLFSIAYIYIFLFSVYTPCCNRLLKSNIVFLMSQTYLCYTITLHFVDTYYSNILFTYTCCCNTVLQCVYNITKGIQWINNYT